MLDDDGEYKKKAPQEEMEARLGVLKSMCVSREEADQSALQAQDIIMEVGRFAAFATRVAVCSASEQSIWAAGVNDAKLVAAMGAPDTGVDVPDQTGGGVCSVYRDASVQCAHGFTRAHSSHTGTQAMQHLTGRV